jgi:hypothetical protein
MVDELVERARHGDREAFAALVQLTGGRPIYETATYESDPVRWHTPDGRALKTFDPETLDADWSLSPTGAGPTVHLFSQWNLHFEYGVPGDRSTRVLTGTGSYWQVTAKGYGLVWHDLGLVRFVTGSQDESAVTHGPTDSNYGDLDLVLPKVCEILTRGSPPTRAIRRPVLDGSGVVRARPLAPSHFCPIPATRMQSGGERGGPRGPCVDGVAIAAQHRRLGCWSPFRSRPPHCTGVPGVGQLVAWAGRPTRSCSRPTSQACRRTSIQPASRGTCG